MNPLRILILGLNFYPEPTGIGRYTGEMAAFLAENGHELHVICAPPYYPQWKVEAGYHQAMYRREEWRGMQVRRCPIWVPKRLTGIKRGLHLLSFAASSFPPALWEVGWKPQVVLTVAPTILTAPATLMTSRLSRTRSWLHIQDFELDAGFELGMLPGRGFLPRAAKAYERMLLRRFERISCISRSMLERAVQKGVEPGRLSLLPNWVDLEEISPIQADPAAFGFPPDKVVALYSGNLGEKQGLSMLFDVAGDLEPHDEIHIVICGEGSRRAKIETMAGKSSNVSFLDLQPRERLNKLLNCAAVHLLPQLSGVSDLVMPSKLAAMMASGKPTVASAEPDSAIAESLSGAGIVTPPGDAGAMARAILELSSDPERRDQLGASARRYARGHFSKEAILGSLLKEIEEFGR